MLDKIIKSCKYVTNNSKSVKINETKELKPYHLTRNINY